MRQDLHREIIYRLYVVCLIAVVGVLISAPPLMALPPGPPCIPGEFTVGSAISVNLTGPTGEVMTGDPATFTATASDYDYCPKNYTRPQDRVDKFTWYVDGVLYSAGNDHSQITISFRTSGSHIVRVTADDYPDYADDPPAGNAESGGDEVTVTVVHNPNLCIRFTYDENGNRASMIDTRGTTGYLWDRLRRLTKVTETDATYIEYAYDWANNRTSMRDHFGGMTTYAYNDRELLQTLTFTKDQTNYVTTYAYDSSGALERMDYPNGSYAVYTYKDRGWLETLRHRKSDDTLLAEFIYDYDTTTCGKNGTRTGMTEKILKTDNSTYIEAAIAYTYDDAYRLTGETRSGQNALVTYTKTYLYDLVGNRTRMVVDGNTTTYYHYDSAGANKLMNYGSSDTSPYTGNTFLAYDSAGNLVSETPPQSGPVTTYEWNWNDKLARVVRGGTQLALFTYDGLSVRRTAQFSSGTTGFLYDGDRVIAEVDSAGNLYAYYVIGRGGTVSRLTASTVRYYHGDGLASVKALTDGSQAVTDDYSYDAWGNPLVQPGATAQPYQYVGGLGYYTQYQEPLFDQLQLGARYYDAGIGRFTSRDPVRDGDNSYEYVADNPANSADPSGLFRIPKPWGWPDTSSKEACLRSCQLNYEDIITLANAGLVGGTVICGAIAVIGKQPLIGGIGELCVGLCYASALVEATIYRRVCFAYCEWLFRPKKPCPPRGGGSGSGGCGGAGGR